MRVSRQRYQTGSVRKVSRSHAFAWEFRFYFTEYDGLRRLEVRALARGYTPPDGMCMSRFMARMKPQGRPVSRYVKRGRVELLVDLDQQFEPHIVPMMITASGTACITP